MAAAALTLTCSPSVPFLLRYHYRRGCNKILPTISASIPRRRRLINNRPYSSNIHSAAAKLVTPLLLVAPSYPIYNGKPASSSTRIRRREHTQFWCYCTEAAGEAQNNAADNNTFGAAPARKDFEDNNSDGGSASIIREAANTLDIRVGRIVKAWRHEEADSLYVEEVDIGEPQPRTICSGLVKYIPLHLLQDRSVIVLANLKPRNMRGVKSFGMLMAASDAAHENVELLAPPEGAVPGDRVWFGSLDEKENLPDVASPNQVQKKKIWEQVQPHLKTDESCVATLGTKHQMRTSAGLIISQSLKNANVS